MENIMRRSSAIKFKRYIIVFFALLFVFIWVNHNSQYNSPKEDSVEHFSLPEHKDEVVTPHRNRKSELEERRKRFHKRLLRIEMPEITEQSSRKFPEDPDYEDDSLFMSDIRRRKLRSSPPSRFFVNSSKCKMPYPDPLSDELIMISYPVKWKKCSDKVPIFALKFDQKLQQYRLQLNTTLSEKFERSVSKLSCRYREVYNNTNSTWKNFGHEAVIDGSPSGIVAECQDAMSTAGLRKQDAFPLVRVPRRSDLIQSNPLDRRPSVLMLGFGSISRMNFKRSMPKTAKFVQQAGWFEMEGYNKVGGSAFSNLCAILAGSKSDENCGKRFSTIWKAYKLSGYTTAFGEDSLDSSVPPEFPVDNQHRILMKDISKSIGSGQALELEHCIGSRPSLSYLYDFCMQFAQRLIEELDQPAFGLFWSSTFTRDYLHGATSLDDEFVAYLEQLRQHHVFERAIVILFSDQGQTSGDLVDLADGYLEERLPMLHIHLPLWFRTTYPKFANNLFLNRNRLTSPYDLHNTLRHILNLKASVPQELVSLVKCRNSQSLMHLIPLNRSCEEACVGLHWCACNEFVLVPNNVDAYHLAKVFVFYINGWMLRNRFNRFCQRLRLAELDYVERNVASSVDFIIYRLRIRTFPTGGVFETTLRYNPEQAKIIDISMKEIGSQNYHNRANCVQNRMAKKFCFCYPTNKDDEMKLWMKTKLK